MCDVLDYFGQNLAGPILAALIGGPLVAVGFRYFAIPREIGDHDARAVEFNQNLRRWVRDRNRQLQSELRTLVNQAGLGIVSLFPVPRHEHPPQGTGSQLYSGALGNAAVGGMRQALHEYRDEASGRVSEYAALARSEGGWHRWHRKLHKRPAIPFGLPRDEIAVLGEWRTRRHPFEGEQTISVSDDPTEEWDIAPLETDAGLIWEEAAKHGTL